ncbi:hypothetical protein DXF96_00220 [Heyndrickxia coagulans]|uniref:hypothetical protein n=1 Tax=Heyndrickxia coagulans TaxID=1398 RepID=UPI000D73F317|nr:hypothetical protein [Heyndrickxia coagulans]AWP37785.1 hypothetical protein CYJ15_12730 [Heyndrickxia coagulans]MED4962989.1 hypothetical protein [Heyndrickxia coagulans]QDI60098.1 hypothetical protein DXF96_00220 [Heyndrickxia coagulans]
MRTVQDELKKWKKNNKPRKNKARGRPRKRKSEHLSEREIKDLMGYYEPVFRRGKGGALRQR